MSDLVIDTHAAVWYFAKAPEMSALARNTMNQAVANGNVIFLPTISLIEIVYLIEKGRLAALTLTYLTQYLKLPNSGFVAQDLTLEIAQTMQQISRSIVPDMPDRIIAATALHLGLPLVTKDSKIRHLNNVQTIW